MTNTTGRAAALAGLAAALVAADVPGIYAEDTVAARVHHATFAGPIARDGTSGEAGDHPNTVDREPGRCMDVARQSCRLTWDLDHPVTICDATPEQGPVGFATYMNSEGHAVSVRVQALKGAGAGVLEGALAGQNDSGNPVVFQVHIDASDTCAARAAAAEADAVDTWFGVDLGGAVAHPGQFTGYVDYS